MKIKILVISILLFLISPTTKATLEYKAYFPIVISNRNNCGTEVWRGAVRNPQLEFLGCAYTRYNPGTSTLPGLYTTWKKAGSNWNSLNFAGIDIAAIRSQHSKPVVVFFGNALGTCNKPAVSSFQNMANFIRDAIILWNLEIIEVWNEVDFTAGNPNLYGCWGIGQTSTFVQYLQIVTSTIWATHPEVIIGVSFGMSDSSSIPMVQAVSNNYQNEDRFFIGIHSYKYYIGTETYPITSKLLDVSSVWNGNIWITETNMLYSGSCLDEGFQQAQADYTTSVLELADVTFIYGLFKYNESWKCAALLDNDISPNKAFQVIQPKTWPYPAP